MAITTATKLPTCLVSAAALPLAEAPEPDDPVAEAVGEARPVETTAPVVAEVTIVVVQLQSEL